MDKLRSLRFGYIPYRAGAGSPGDRRRFPRVAREYGLNWEEYREGQDYDVVYTTSNADLTSFHRTPPGGPKLVFEMVDSYLDVKGFDGKGLIRGLGKYLLKRHAHLELKLRQHHPQSGPTRRSGYLQHARAKARLQPAQRQRAHDFSICTTSWARPQSGQPLPDDDGLHLFWEGLGLTVNQFSRLQRPH